jgi:Family of unknown function (DUF6599)
MNFFFIHRVVLAVLFAAVFCLASGCQHHSASATGFFPESGEAAGWTKAPEVRTFSPDKLSDYIDGDAEKYLKAGVRSTSTADYKFKDQIQVTVDIYTMSGPAGAKTIFESEPAMDAKTPTLGDAARLFSQSLVFRKGPYLVSMVAYQDSPEVTQALFSLGQAVEKKLPR